VKNDNSLSSYIVGGAVGCSDVGEEMCRWCCRQQQCRFWGCRLAFSVPGTLRAHHTVSQDRSECNFRRNNAVGRGSWPGPVVGACISGILKIIIYNIRYWDFEKTEIKMFDVCKVIYCSSKHFCITIKMLTSKYQILKAEAMDFFLPINILKV